MIPPLPRLRIYQPYFPLILRIIMSNKFIFHKDRFGVHVYYAGMNGNNFVENIDGLLINGEHKFSPTQTCCVPSVESISAITIATQPKRYINSETQRIMSITEYNRYEQEWNDDNKSAVGIDEEVAALAGMRRFRNEWELEYEDVENIEEYEFEIIDIEYPADERLIPLRHVDEKQINYFQVDVKSLGLKLIHKLCEEAKLTQSTSGDFRTYSIESWQGVPGWHIEGVAYGKALHCIRFDVFTGHLQECREKINYVESQIHDCFDRWLISGKTSKGITVKFFTDHLDSIEGWVSRIASKKKTDRQHRGALEMIALVKAEVLKLGAQELMAEE